MAILYHIILIVSYDLLNKTGRKSQLIKTVLDDTQGIDNVVVE